MTTIEADNIPEFKLPVGHQKFHKKQVCNFQSKRPYAFNHDQPEDLLEAGKKQRNLID